MIALHVTEHPVVLDDRRVGTHTVHRGSSALTSSRLRSWEIVAEIEGWRARHPGAWPEGRGVVEESDVVYHDDREASANEEGL